jgi:hypothetical protein
MTLFGLPLRLRHQSITQETLAELKISWARPGLNHVSLEVELTSKL